MNIFIVIRKVEGSVVCAMFDVDLLDIRTKVKHQRDDGDDVLGKVTVCQQKKIVSLETKGKGNMLAKKQKRTTGPNLEP